MISSRRAVALVVSVITVGVAIGAVALAQGGEEGTDAELLQAGIEATPEFGEQIPLCPSDELGDALKDADIAFGPCRPVPDDATPEEREAAAAAADQYLPVSEEETGEDCPSYEFNTSAGPIDAEFPCGSVVREPANFAQALVEERGALCIDVDFARSPQAELETKRFCVTPADELEDEHHHDGEAGQ